MVSQPGVGQQGPGVPGWLRRQLTSDDIVVLIFALLGFAGSVALVLFTSVPAIIASFWMATGIAGLAYRYLGGIQIASFTVGALRLGGAIAALVGIALLIDACLVRELPFRLPQNDMLVGEWRWVYAAEGWEGHLVFTKEKGQYRFIGEESKWINGKREPLLDLRNGTARLIGRNELQLEVDVHDRQYNSDYHWISTAPLLLRPAFRGELRRNPDDGFRWGMMIYKWPPTQ